MHHEYIRTISTAVLAILAVGGVTVAANEYLDAREQDLNTRIEQLETDVSALKTDVSALKLELDLVKETVIGNTAILEAIAARVGATTNN